MFKLVYVTSSHIALALPEQELQVLKLKNPLVKFCLLVLEKDIIGSIKSIKKLGNDELYCALKFAAKKCEKLPNEYYTFLNKLPASLQLTSDLLAPDEILTLVQKHSVPIQVLTRLCYNFAVRSKDAEVTALVNALIESGKSKEAVKLVDYVRENKEKAEIFARCGRYGEAYLFAKAAGETSLMNEMQNLMLTKVKA